MNQAYLLNNPLEAAVKENEGGTLPDAYSFVTCSQDNVVVEVVKKRRMRRLSLSDSTNALTEGRTSPLYLQRI